MNRNNSGREKRESCLSRRNSIKEKSWVCLWTWYPGSKAGEAHRLDYGAFQASVGIWTFISNAGRMWCKLPFLPSILKRKWHGPIGLLRSSGWWLFGVTVNNYLACRPSAATGRLPGRPGAIHQDHRQRRHSGWLGSNTRGLDCVLIKFHQIFQSFVICFLRYLTSQGQERTCLGWGVWQSREQGSSTGNQAAWDSGTEPDCCSCNPGTSDIAGPCGPLAARAAGCSLHPAGPGSESTWAVHRLYPGLSWNPSRHWENSPACPSRQPPNPST